MAELWKRRARKPLERGSVNVGILRGFTYFVGGNKNDISVEIGIGEHRIVMTQAEFELAQEKITYTLKDFS